MSDVITMPGRDQSLPGTKNLEIVIENGGVRTSTAPLSTSAAAIVSALTSVAATNVVLKATPGNLYGATCCSTGAAGYLMLFDAVALPANGVVSPRKVWPVAAGGGIEVGYFIPLRMSIGAVLVFSSTGPFTLTAASAFMSGEIV